MIHRCCLPLLILGIGSLHAATGPGKADTRGFRPECAALIPYKVEPPIVPPKAVEIASPKFGPLARRTMRIQGLMILDALIDDEGRVCDARILKGILSGNPQLFDEPIRESILKSRFQPATFGGVPVAVVYRLTVKVGI